MTKLDDLWVELAKYQSIADDKATVTLGLKCVG
jgi:hypothetical protein